MKITNKYGLPLNTDLFLFPKPNPETLSVTRLIDSPQIPHLITEHWDTLEVDVNDMLYQIEGQAVHAIMQGHAPESSFSEEDMHVFIMDVMLTGRSDLFHPAEEKITDWKGTSVWTYIRNKKRWGGVRPEWIKQLNVYAYMWRSMGYPVSKLSAWLWLRDWTDSERARSGPDYPECRFTEVVVPAWTQTDAEAYVVSRINTHKIARDTGIYECSPEERWQMPDTYAVMKAGRKTAVAVFGENTTRGGTIADAEMYVAEHSGEALTMDVRPGGYIRCENYCNVRSICPQWKATPKLDKTA